MCPFPNGCPPYHVFQRGRGAQSSLHASRISSHSSRGLPLRRQLSIRHVTHMAMQGRGPQRGNQSPADCSNGGLVVTRLPPTSDDTAGPRVLLSDGCSGASVESANCLPSGSADTADRCCSMLSLNSREPQAVTTNTSAPNTNRVDLFTTILLFVASVPGLVVGAFSRLTFAQ